MIRICGSLSGAGFGVLLVGRKKKNSVSLQKREFDQKRLYCFFEKGKLFYVEYNIRLFFFLLFKKADCFAAIDLDTILPCLLISGIKRTRRVYDAHEYFSQQKEIISRPGIYSIWKWIEGKTIPKYKTGYTVSQSIAEEFKKIYGVDYEVIRNMPVLSTIQVVEKLVKNILYQGAVNEARGLEFLIPAMKKIDATLVIYGDGNFMDQTKALIASNNLQDKVLLKGKVLPADLELITDQAYIGLNLVEPRGLNQYYSLANKFFDYIHHAIPQVTMNFPEYKRVNDDFEIAILIDDPGEEKIANAINKLLKDKILYNYLKNNCLKAREIYNWQQEEIKLIAFYKKIFAR
jgi:glycosyltransferase involved in cell wall biosynthesis